MPASLAKRFQGALFPMNIHSLFPNLRSITPRLRPSAATNQALSDFPTCSCYRLTPPCRVNFCPISASGPRHLNTRQGGSIHLHNPPHRNHFHSKPTGSGETFPNYIAAVSAIQFSTVNDDNHYPEALFMPGFQSAGNDARNSTGTEDDSSRHFEAFVKTRDRSKHSCRRMASRLQKSRS